jgi:hypothetical protein
MNKLKTNLVMAAAFAVLVIIGTIMNSQHATAQPPVPSDGLAVRLISPLPVPVTGNTTVSGTVSLASGATVQVGNTVSNPVRVRDVNDGIQPFQFRVRCTSTVGSVECVPFGPLVAPGKRLVIEYASLEACMLPGQAAVLEVGTTLSGVFVPHALPLTPVAPGRGSTIIECNSPLASSETAIGQQVRLYADPGTSVGLDARRTSATGSASFSISISGYLVRRAVRAVGVFEPTPPCAVCKTSVSASPTAVWRGSPRVGFPGLHYGYSVT